MQNLQVEEEAFLKRTGLSSYTPLFWWSVRWVSNHVDKKSGNPTYGTDLTLSRTGQSHTGKKILLKTQNKYFTSFCAFALPPQTNTIFLWGAIIILIQISHVSLTLPRMGSRRSKTWWKRRNHSPPSQAFKEAVALSSGIPLSRAGSGFRKWVKLVSGQN